MSSVIELLLWTKNIVPLTVLQCRRKPTFLDPDGVSRKDEAGNVSDFAGTGTAGNVNGELLDAQFNFPNGILGLNQSGKKFSTQAFDPTIDFKGHTLQAKFTLVNEAFPGPLLPRCSGPCH